MHLWMSDKQKNSRCVLVEDRIEGKSGVTNRQVAKFLDSEAAVAFYLGIKEHQ